MFCNNEYDVVVIGAGPGGSVAARNLSRAGHKVLLLEKREKIGYPVRCGEASTKLSDLQTYGPIDEDCIETIINGLYIYGPNGVNIDLSQKGTGIMLNREKFDPWLAHLAANDGVEVVTRARAEFVGDVESGTRLVRVKLGEGAGETTEEVRAKMVIAADGVESRIGRQVGLDCLQKPAFTCTGVDIQVQGILTKPDYLTFWQGHDFINDGYIWSFPKVKTATTFVNYVTDMYNSAAGKGAEDSKTYAVFNVNDWTPKGVEVLAADGEEVSGFYVTNAAYSYTSMINGDDYAKKFGQDDWFKLTVTGYDAAGEQTGTVDFYLADLRDAQASYILKTWRWVDLTSLGKVKRLGFSLSSSDNGTYGMNTPAYFCLDNLGGVKPENEGPIPTGILQLLNSTNGSQQRYDLGGRKLDRQVKGLNIVRMPDGTVRKVMVK